MRRLIFGILSLLLLGIEVLIGLFAHGWVRSYLGDVLVVILLYTIVRTIIPYKIRKWFVLPTIILVFSFIVEFLQLWGFCEDNRLRRQRRLQGILAGTRARDEDRAF